MHHVGGHALAHYGERSAWGQCAGADKARCGVGASLIRCADLDWLERAVSSHRAPPKIKGDPHRWLVKTEPQLRAQGLASLVSLTLRWQR